MKISNTRFASIAKAALGLAFFSVLATQSFGEDGKGQAGGPGGKGPMSRTDMIAHHEKMLEFHTKVIACLKSTKTDDECKKETSDMCAEVHGGKCPMDEMHMGHMMGGKHRMGDCPEGENCPMHDKGMQKGDKGKEKGKK
jgi:hypothetical protein